MKLDEIMNVERYYKLWCEKDSNEEEVANGYRIYATMGMERASMRISVNLYLVTRDNRISDPITVQRSTVICSKGWVKPLYDWEAMLGDDDVNAIIKEMGKYIDKEPSVLFEEKEPADEVREKISACIHQEAGKEELSQLVSIQGKYGCVRTTYMDEFLKDAKVGRKRKEVLDIFRVRGWLDTDKGRYDKTMRLDGGQPAKYYRILLEDEEAGQDGEEMEMGKITEFKAPAHEKGGDAA